MLCRHPAIWVLDDAQDPWLVWKHDSSSSSISSLGGVCEQTTTQQHERPALSSSDQHEQLALSSADQLTRQTQVIHLQHMLLTSTKLLWTELFGGNSLPLHAHSQALEPN